MASPTAVKVGAYDLDKALPGPRHTLPVLQGVSLTVAAGEFVSVIGPSGCGKSTFLSILAGLDEPTNGTVVMPGLGGSERLGQIAYMQQKDLLLPWRSVIDNAVLPLELSGVPRAQARQRALELTSRFGLGGFEEYYPDALSGGMRQRAAFLRTVLAERDVLLLDEPFGALDALTRSQMQEWLLELWSQFGKTIVLVTHDVDEALFLSDRVYVFTARPGRVKMVLPIALPRPRTYEMVTDETFTALKAQLLTAIREEAAATQEPPWR